MNHRFFRTVFAVIVGLLVAVMAYKWVTDPSGRIERAQQERVVVISRNYLRLAIGEQSLEIVDALLPNRKVGRVYVYPEVDGWAVSGYYRRDEGDRWHPYLMSISSELVMTSLKMQDTNPQLAERAAADPLLEISR